MLVFARSASPAEKYAEVGSINNYMCPPVDEGRRTNQPQRKLKMKTLNPHHLNEARAAILDRFVELNTPPEGIANIHQFSDLMVKFTDGYFEGAFQDLLGEHRIEWTSPGRFVKLTTKGYEEAHGI